MQATLTIPLWAIMAVANSLVWGAAFFWPKGQAGGDYDFGPALVAMFHLLLAVIGTLLIWLVYFIVV